MFKTLSGWIGASAEAPAPPAPTADAVLSADDDEWVMVEALEDALKRSRDEAVAKKVAELHRQTDELIRDPFFRPEYAMSVYFGCPGRIHGWLNYPYISIEHKRYTSKWRVLIGDAHSYLSNLELAIPRSGCTILRRTKSKQQPPEQQREPKNIAPIFPRNYDARSGAKPSKRHSATPQRNVMPWRDTAHFSRR